MITTLIILMTLITPAQAANKPAETEAAKVISLSYKENKSMMYSPVRFELRREQDGTYIMTNGSERPDDEAEQVVVPVEFVDSIQKIVAEEKMNRYLGFYAPEFEVMDGTSWYLDISFSDKSSISSSGYMNWPEGRGVQRLVKYLKEVLVLTANGHYEDK